MIIKKIKLKDLKLMSDNPRIITPEELEKLKGSIKEFGYIQPIILNQKTNNVIGGNQRLKILKELHNEDFEIEIVVVDLDENKEKALNLALNKISGDWDYDKLSEILKNLDKNDFNLTGFDNFDLEILTDIKLDTNIRGKETGIRYPLTFWFDTEQEHDKITKFFQNNKFGWKYKKEPNTFLLKKLLKLK